MIERYTLPEMGKIWTDSAKFQSWLKVEIAACEANFSLGKIPENALKEIRLNAKIFIFNLLYLPEKCYIRK